MAALVGAYFYWESRVSKTQQLKDQNVELTQALKDIKDLQSKMDVISTTQSSMLVELNRKNSAVVTRQETIRSYINSPEAQSSNRDSSEVLRETVRRMGNEN